VGSSPTSGTYINPCKSTKTESKAKGQDSNPGPFYTNYYTNHYTNALRLGVLPNFGSPACPQNGASLACFAIVWN
jgi:hypothetical protein